MGSAALAEEYCDFVYTHYYILQQRRARTAAGISASATSASGALASGAGEQLLPAPVDAQRGNMKFVPPDDSAEQKKSGASHSSGGSSRVAQPDIYLHLMQAREAPTPFACRDPRGFQLTRLRKEAEGSASGILRVGKSTAEELRGRERRCKKERKKYLTKRA